MCLIANPPTPKVTPGNVADPLYRLFVERVREYAMLFLDKNGNIASWNDGAEIIKGYAPEEVIGKHFSIFYPPAEVANRRPQYELQVATMDGRFEDEGWRVKKGGGMFWANVVITAVKDIDGTLLGFAKITRDLTDRRNAEEALRQSEEQHRLVIESVKDHAIFVLDPRGRIASWNKGAERLLGYAHEDILGKPFGVFVHPDHPPVADPIEMIAQGLAEAGLTTMAHHKRSDGSKFQSSVTMTPIRGASGDVRGIAVVMQDLSSRETGQHPSHKP